MCTIVFAWQVHPDYPLVVAANRDEYFGRQTAPADWWPEAPEVLAGRDLAAGGTWLGVTRAGRLAAITNFRDGVPEVGQRSRGAIVSDFLDPGLPARTYMQALASTGTDYAGFNLLGCDLATAPDGGELHYATNRGTAQQDLPPGIYGVSNALLDTPWPKVERAKRGIETILESGVETEAIFALFADTSCPPDDALPDTNVGLDVERTLAPVFVASPVYGTRNTTICLVHRSRHVRFVERGFAAGGETIDTLTFDFELDPAP